YLFLLSASPPTTFRFTLSLHDALPICLVLHGAAQAMAFEHRKPPQGLLSAVCLDSVAVGVDHERRVVLGAVVDAHARLAESRHTDRKSTRLNSSHDQISYAVFCLKKKK